MSRHCWPLPRPATPLPRTCSSRTPNRAPASQTGSVRTNSGGRPCADIRFRGLARLAVTTFSSPARIYPRRSSVTSASQSPFRLATVLAAVPQRRQAAVPQFPLQAKYSNSSSTYAPIVVRACSGRGHRSRGLRNQRAPQVRRTGNHGEQADSRRAQPRLCRPTRHRLSQEIANLACLGSHSGIGRCAHGGKGWLALGKREVLIGRRSNDCRFTHRIPKYTIHFT